MLSLSALCPTTTPPNLLQSSPRVHSAVGKQAQQVQRAAACVWLNVFPPVQLKQPACRAGTGQQQQQYQCEGHAECVEVRMPGGRHLPVGSPSWTRLEQAHPHARRAPTEDPTRGEARATALRPSACDAPQNGREPAVADRCTPSAHGPGESSAHPPTQGQACIHALGALVHHLSGAQRIVPHLHEPSRQGKSGRVDGACGGGRQGCVPICQIACPQRVAAHPHTNKAARRQAERGSSKGVGRWGASRAPAGTRGRRRCPRPPPAARKPTSCRPA